MDLSSYYDQLHSGKPERFRTWYRNAITDWKACHLLGLLPNDVRINSVAELGAQEGHLLHRVAEALHATTRVGFEISHVAVERCREEHPDIEMRMVDENGPLPASRNSIDLLILSDIMEHVPNLENTLAEARRISRYMAFKIPIENNLYHRTHRLALNRRRFGLGHPSGHLRGFSVRSATAVLHRNGLSILRFEVARSPRQLINYAASTPRKLFESLIRCVPSTRLRVQLLGGSMFALCEASEQNTDSCHRA